MGDRLEEHIGAVDAFTVTLERDRLLRATIVAVAVFEGVPDWSVLTDRVERATRLVPRFREKLVDAPFGLAPPRWIVDADFDLSLHLRRGAVSPGGGLEAVLDAARVAGLTAFDRERPLWEFNLLEGLPDGRSALVMKIHHALTDGIGGIELAAHVVDLEPGPVDLGALPAPPEPTGHGAVEAVVDTVGYHGRRTAGIVGGLTRSAWHNTAHLLTDPLGAVAGGIGNVRDITRFVRPVTRTGSTVMSQRRPMRHHFTIDVQLEAIRAAAHQVGSTVNDAYLAAIAGGMHHYHEHHDAPVDHMWLCMPLSVRTDADGPGGNRVTLERFRLPVGGLGPGVRMVEIGQICRALRDDRAIPYAPTIAGALNMLPVDVTAGMLKHVDLLASNVPGFDGDVFVGGSRLESFHVFGPTLGSAANLTLMSYRGTCHVGVTADAGAVQDPEVFAACLRDGFDEVVSSAS